MKCWTVFTKTIWNKKNQLNVLPSFSSFCNYMFFVFLLFLFILYLVSLRRSLSLMKNDDIYFWSSELLFLSSLGLANRRGINCLRHEAGKAEMLSYWIKQKKAIAFTFLLLEQWCLVLCVYFQTLKPIQSILN